jgi:hypothetical protein
MRHGWDAMLAEVAVVVHVLVAFVLVFVAASAQR